MCSAGWEKNHPDRGPGPAHEAANDANDPLNTSDKVARDYEADLVRSPRQCSTPEVVDRGPKWDSKHSKF